MKKLLYRTRGLEEMICFGTLFYVRSSFEDDRRWEGLGDFERFYPFLQVN